jgi:hypothetical protein
MSKLFFTPPTYPPLKDRLDFQCKRLAEKVSSCEGHPLEECFQRRDNVSAMVLRKTKKFLPLAGKEKLRKTFTKFAI